MSSMEDKTPKKVTRVTVNEVVQKKPSLGRKFREVFINDDAESVRDYILFDVLVPAIKDTVFDAISSGFERVLFGDSSRRRRSGPTNPYTPGYVSYNKYSSSSSPSKRPETSRRDRNISIDDILLKTRPEAEEVIERLADLIERYQEATVNDLYELIGAAGDFTGDVRGWTDIREARVERYRNEGYLLVLPPVEQLKA